MGRRGNKTFVQKGRIAGVIFNHDDVDVVELREHVRFQLAEVEGGPLDTLGVQLYGAPWEQGIDPVPDGTTTELEVSVGDHPLADALTISHRALVVNGAVQRIKQTVAISIRRRHTPVRLER